MKTRPTKTSKPAPKEKPVLSLDDRVLGYLIRKHFRDQVLDEAQKNLFKRPTTDTCSEATVSFLRSLDSVEFDEASAELLFLAFQELLSEQLVCWMHDEITRTRTPFKTASGHHKPALTEDGLMTIAQVQDRTGMGKNFCYKLCKAGKLEVRMLTARTLRVTVNSVDAWIESRNPMPKNSLSTVVAKSVAEPFKKPRKK